VTQPAGPRNQFITEEEAARRLNTSTNSLISAIQRNEVPGVVRVGRSVRLFWPAIVLSGLHTDAGTLAKQLGVSDLDSLMRFISGNGRGYDCSCADNDRPLSR